MLMTPAEVNALSAAVTTRRKKLRRRATRWLVWGNDAIVQKTLKDVETLDNLTAKLANVQGHALLGVVIDGELSRGPVEFHVTAPPAFTMGGADMDAPIDAPDDGHVPIYVETSHPWHPSDSNRGAW